MTTRVGSYPLVKRPRPRTVKVVRMHTVVVMGRAKCRGKEEGDLMRRSHGCTPAKRHHASTVKVAMMHTAGAEGRTRCRRKEERGMPRLFQGGPPTKL